MSAVAATFTVAILLMNILFYYLIAIISSYLLGSIPFGYLIVKLLKGVDIRSVGSGNIGATNVARILGWPAGISVLLLDITKGVVTTLYFPPIIWFHFLPKTMKSDYWLGLPPTDLIINASIVCGLFSIIGHLYPVYLKFKGGKGVATGLGVFLVLTPFPVVLVLGVWVVALLLFRYVSLASISAAIFLPTTLFLTDKDIFNSKKQFFIFAVLCMIMVVLKHIPNIKRLIAGTEPKVRFRKNNSC